MSLTTHPHQLRRLLPFAFSMATTLVALTLAPGQAVAAASHVLVRIPAHAAPPPEWPALVAEWRQSSELASLRVLAGAQPEKPSESVPLQALAILGFPSEETCEAWMRKVAPKLPAALGVRPARVLTEGGPAPRDSRSSLFVVNIYKPKVDRARYEAFTRGYLTPLYAAQHATGHLVHYSFYWEEGPADRADAIAVLEYRNADALATLAGGLKNEIRATLSRTTPTYLEYHAIKDELRGDGGSCLLFAAGTP